MARIVCAHQQRAGRWGYPLREGEQVRAVAVAEVEIGEEDVVSAGADKGRGFGGAGTDRQCCPSQRW